jgi:hypothetical protein
MQNYEIVLEYSVPEIANINLQAESEDDAEELALDEFKAQNPEAIDVSVVSVLKADELAKDEAPF